MKKKSTKLFRDLLIGNPESHGEWEQLPIAHIAMLQYERNAMKYDKPNQATHVPIKERIDAYARLYGTTVEEMKKYRNEVEKTLENER